MAPMLAGGAGDRLLAGQPIMPPEALKVEHVLEEDDNLFIRLSTVRG
jgi:hypothetical protein